MNQKNLFTRSAVAAAMALVSSHVYAAGFQLNEYTAASGSRNPATMTMFDRPTFSGGAVFIDPDVKLTGKSPVTGSSLDANNIAPTQWVPNLHFIMPLNDSWAVGASATTNYGLSTEFNSGYPAGPLAGKTDLMTENLNLSTAYRLNQHFSFGVGFDAVYAKAKIERNAGELVALQSRGQIPADTTAAHLNGNAWGYGWNAGILYEVDENNRYGFTYRSKVNVDFDGNYRSDLPVLAGGTGGSTQAGHLTLNLPEVWEVSGYNRVAPKWAVHYSMTYTSWSEFQQLKATANNGDTLFQKEEGYHDVYRIALGTTYYYSDEWTFRTGIAFDDSPVPADNRTISIPDQDRLWLSAGATYAFSKDASVDLGVSYMHGKTVHISEKVADGVPNYEFDAKGTAMLYGMNFNYTF
jgi:long-chain fatty acid transport protein